MSFLERTNSYQKIDWRLIKKRQGQFNIILRQSKRIAALSLKRQNSLLTPVIDSDQNFLSCISPYLKSLYPSLSSDQNSQKLKSLYDLLSNSDILIIKEVLLSLNCLLTNSSIYVQPVIYLGFPSAIRKFLSFNYPEEILEQAVRVFSNLLSEDQSIYLVDEFLLTALICLTNTQNLNILEYSLQALSNISADSEEFRRELIKRNFIKFLNSACELNSVDLNKIISWSISNITKEPENINQENLEYCTAIIMRLLKSNDHDTVAESLWALVNLSSEPDLVQKIIDASLIHVTFGLLAWDSTSVRLPALKVIGNICSTTHEHTQFILNLGIFDLLNSDVYVKSNLALDSFWIISNIAAGTHNQVKALVNHNIFDIVISSLVHYDMPTKMQITNIIINLLKASKNLVKENLLKKNIFCILALALHDFSSDYSRNILEICEELIPAPVPEAHLEESGFLNSLEQMLKHPNTTIYDQVLKIISIISGNKP